MEDGILIVIKAKTCGACIYLTKKGFFDALMDDLDIKDVVILELDDIRGFDSSTEGHEVYNIEPWYPSFKYMTISTHDQIGKVPAREIFKKMCLYNGKIENNTYVRAVEYEGLPTLESIQNFCDKSALELSKSKGARQNSKAINIVQPKYKRRY